jgi:hypothetical protein
LIYKRNFNHIAICGLLLELDQISNGQLLPSDGVFEKQYNRDVQIGLSCKPAFPNFNWQQD